MPLKIGLVLDASLDPPDGVQQYVVTVGRWLTEAGHAVHYLVGESKRRDIPQVHSLTRNVSVRFNGNVTRIPLPASKRRIRELLAREKFDVLHIQTPYSPFLAGRIIKAADPGTAIVGTFHVVPESKLVSMASRLLGLWEYRTLRRFDHMYSVSRAAADFAHEAFGLSSTVLPNAVAFERFQAAKPFPATVDGLLNVLFLGRLVPRKGCMLLLQAVKLLKDELGVPAFTVTVCGAGPLRGKLEQFVRENGLTAQVRFAGFVPEEDKPRHYASADITVFPSTGGESFGIVLIEAMASGRAAVLGGDNVGYRSVLGECPERVLFDPLDAPALARRLLELLADRGLRQRIAKWQSEHARQFDIERVGAELEQGYVSALRRRRNVR